MTYTVHCLPGMLALGQARRVFTSVQAFDGYISTVRAAGLRVFFSSPTACTITREAQA
ncbi:hypothetical protein [Xylophilus ampelinus]|uniref:Uncharacterized protein n=1 Tax=Xylophilus ampelinus TaxID=54067 RepID=A0A318SPK6_9BURK|nr:hypothetical protein [Xylophilus ampelinus]MCS4508782.1 hypothetical protein [Xylophilus ampelinus]PYE79352.1 hypothetical protein DFQ15_10283 [Xylophilus ampelinus]